MAHGDEKTGATYAKTHVLADGYKRALTGVEEYLAKRRAEIAVRVSESYASEFSSAGFIRRIMLRRRMKTEIELMLQSEIEQNEDTLTPPPDALY